MRSEEQKSYDNIDYHFDVSFEEEEKIERHRSRQDFEEHHLDIMSSTSHSLKAMKQISNEMEIEEKLYINLNS